MTPPAHGVPLPANPQCPICSTEQNLSRCKACQVVSYCGRDHQTLHWKQGHKATCSDIKNTNLMIKDETEILNSLPATPEFDEKPFENSVGHFWNIYDTRNYMRARYMHAEALLLVKNRTAVEAALDHLLDMLRLARSDHIGIRNKVPALFLRLQKDQQCYDFVKWWFLSAKDCDYDSEDTSLPFMNIRDADAFEPVKEFPLELGDLSQIVMLLLLKWRLSCELKALDNAKTVGGGRLPTELIDQIRSSMVSPATRNNKKLMQDVENGHNISNHIESLNNQITRLYGAVIVRNSHYLPALIEPGEHMKARSVNYEPGSVEEMQVSLRETYDAWLETPGALEWVKNVLAA